MIFGNNDFMDSRKYRVGIDVGTNSVGFAAVEEDDSGSPTRFLNTMVVIHDSGVDPERKDRAIIRLASAGTARRTRRLYRTRRQRLRELDDFISNELGYPLVNLENFADPYESWKVRADLATTKLPNDELPEAMSIALRHMARHRGWRSPYQRVEALHLHAEISKEFAALKERVVEKTGDVFSDDATPAEVLVDLMGRQKVRGADGVLSGKLRQSDNANELRKIASVQGIDDETLNRIIDRVFFSKSPKGKASERVGMDALPGQGSKPRALKAMPSFQKFRVVSVICNLRIKDSGGDNRPLSMEEKEQLIDYLMSSTTDDHVTWTDVADLLHVKRSNLQGTAKEGPDGERPYTRPPVNSTWSKIKDSKIKSLVALWKTGDVDVQSAIVEALSNASVLEDSRPGADIVIAYLESLDDKELESLDKVGLPAGRASYSEDSLERLTERMLRDDCDLFEARKREFNVADDWKPPADPIYAPVGNPGVDRVLKIVNRLLMAAEREWGAPTQINIEHVRSGFSSELMQREFERENERRRAQNEEAVKAILTEKGGNSRVSKYDITRYYAVKRQHCQCLYCGTPITFSDCELDHIVPRKGVGSTNTRVNLAAACRSCNRDKSNLPFAVWAGKASNFDVSIDDAVSRVKQWQRSQNEGVREFRAFQNEVISRLLKTTEDPEIDSRSLESVAWMARELHHRVEYYFQSKGAQTQVSVYRGAVTAQARKSSGLEDKVKMIGGGGKTRLDRRHHAMDAATIALMTPGISTTLSEKNNLRDAQKFTGQSETWKDYCGRTETARKHFAVWKSNMERLTDLFNDKLENDAIPVVQPLRLRLSNSKAHDDGIGKLDSKKLGSVWSLADIDRAATPQIWTALTRCDDFDPTKGLPENANRVIRAQGVKYESEDNIPVFPSNVAAIAVRDGYAEIGSTIHHARIYRIDDGKKTFYSMIRVFAVDLLKHQAEDLFTVKLPPSAISIRTCEDSLRRALSNGTAEYLGWLVPGDEIIVDTSDKAFHTGQIGDLLRNFPVNSFRLTGFPSNSRLRLKPVLLAGEGLRDDAEDSIKKILLGQGWRPAINVLFSKGKPRIVRRNSLGIERPSSNNGLPFSWEA
ncbi:Uncharacterized protein conserved in bacteria [Mobiluncus mulieris]|nr:Uncharacterized protein conserved in bacteria [Mobiluncus mulieris]